MCGRKKSYIAPVKKFLFWICSLFFSGIIVLLILLFVAKINPFTLSYWAIICASGFGLSFSNYVVSERIKSANLLLIVSVSTFLLIHFSLTIPSIYAFTWNIALTLSIVIVGISAYTLIPKSKNFFTIISKIAFPFSFILLAIICIGKFENSTYFNFAFYTLAISSLLLLISILVSIETKK